MKENPIILKTPKEIDILREANQIIAGILDKLAQTVEPGITTGELDKIASSLIKASGGKPAFKGYRMSNRKPYPACICSSVNEEVVHGIPGSRVLKEGEQLDLSEEGRVREADHVPILG